MYESLARQYPTGNGWNYSFLRGALSYYHVIKIKLNIYDKVNVEKSFPAKYSLSVSVLIVSPIHFLLKLVGTLTSFVLPALFYVMKMPRNASLTMACYLMLIGGLVFMVLIPYEVARNFMHKTA